MKLVDGHIINVEKGNDTPEMRDLITHSRCAYEYCKYLKNREELWQYIKNKQAFDYCQHIEDRKEFWPNMFNKWAYWYCYYYTDRDIIWKNITRIKWAYLYCKRVTHTRTKVTGHFRLISRSNLEL